MISIRKSITENYCFLVDLYLYGEKIEYGKTIEDYYLENNSMVIGLILSNVNYNLSQINFY